MVIFAVCLLVAGAVLSLISRVHGLVAVASGVVASLVISAFFLSSEAATGHPLSLTFVIAIVTLQVGYGLGVVARAVLDSRLRPSARRAPLATDRDIAPSSQQSFSRES